MTDDSIYPKWRRVLAGLICIALGGFAVFRAFRHGIVREAHVESVPLWVVIAIVVIGTLIVLTGVGILFHRGFRPPGAP